jgi:cold-inducible RNA-binding protein
LKKSGKISSISVICVLFEPEQMLKHIILDYVEFMMNKKLYVGNLSYETTEDELQKLFIEVGPVVSATLITDRASGRSKGFGFVEMETEQVAQEAIERLNSYELNERTITVSEARPPREHSSGGNQRDRSSRGGGRRRY